MKLNTTLRNNMVGQYESTIGASPVLQYWSGAEPANCAAADSGTLLAEIEAPADWVTAPSAGGVALNGTWSGAGLPAAGAGTNIGHYRLKDSTRTTCYEQGSVTVTSGGGDLEVDNVNVANGQVVNATGWARTQGGA